jgi:hypothetical protein
MDIRRELDSAFYPRTFLLLFSLYSPERSQFVTLRRRGNNHPLEGVSLLDKP